MTEGILALRQKLAELEKRYAEDRKALLHSISLLKDNTPKNVSYSSDGAPTKFSIVRQAINKLGGPFSINDVRNVLKVEFAEEYVSFSKGAVHSALGNMVLRGELKKVKKIGNSALYEKIQQ